MAEYIKREDAIKHLRGACIAKYPLSFSYGIFASADEISKLPTADVVEVVRCKDCRHSEVCPDTLIWCNKIDRLIPPSGFCHCGERKD